ncbi:MAG: hypothetical protein PHC86_07050 [Eubacteriales bacterium]|nr:hypothetical protein [Eubacteriales bacterium]
MSLTKREQILLAVLLIFGILAGGYYLIAKPMLSQIAILQEKNSQLQMEFDQISSELNNLDQLKAEASEKLVLVNKRTMPYYPSIIQEQIILSLNELYQQSQLNVVNESFAFNTSEDFNVNMNTSIESELPPTLLKAVQAYAALEQNSDSQVIAQSAEMSEEQLKAYEASVKSLNGFTVTISFNATYENTLMFVEGLEKLQKKIQINYLDLNAPTDGPSIYDEAGNVVVLAPSETELSGTIELVFRSIPKLSEQDDAQYYDWTLPANTGKSNPFKS